MYRYTTIRSFNFMVSLYSKNLENIECRIMKRYNSLLWHKAFSLQTYEET
jgi:hypothetical protein